MPSITPLVRRALMFSAALLASLTLVGPVQAQQSAGVMTHVLWSAVDAQDLALQFDEAKGAGARWVRVDVGWSSLQEDGPDRYSQWYVERIDQMLTAAEQRGLKVLVTFTTTPCWASTAPADKKQNCSDGWWNRDVAVYPPQDPADYARAFAWMVRRYGRRVGAWEIWNEPNNSSYFASSSPARDYAALVKASYPAIKAADPSTYVIAGSLDSSHYEFTEELYRYGIHGNFDAYSVHPYSLDHSPSHAYDGWTRISFVRGVPAVRDVLLRHGDDVPIWLTEFGYSTSTTRGRQEGWLNGVSEQTQAEWTYEAFEIMRGWSYVPVAFYYGIRDNGPDRASNYDNFGLLRLNNTRKPAFDAFRRGSALLGTPADPRTGGDRPIVEITSPAPGGLVGDTVTIEATAPQGAKGVDFYIDGVKVGSDQSAPYSIETRRGRRGSRARVTAVARDAQGRVIRDSVVVRRLGVHLKRKRGKLFATGHARAGHRVTVRAYRRTGRGRYASRSSYSVTVKAGRNGRFMQLLTSRKLRRGTWRFVATERVRRSTTVKASASPAQAAVVRRLS